MAEKIDSKQWFYFPTDENNQSTVCQLMTLEIYSFEAVKGRVFF